MARARKSRRTRTRTAPKVEEMKATARVDEVAAGYRRYGPIAIRLRPLRTGVAREVDVLKNTVYDLTLRDFGF